jgi:hypothetical protein
MYMITFFAIDGKGDEAVTGLIVEIYLSRRHHERHRAFDLVFFRSQFAACGVFDGRGTPTSGKLSGRKALRLPTLAFNYNAQRAVALCR